MIRRLARFGNLIRSNSLLICFLIALYAATVPVFRSFCTMEIDYNEGWNVYNATLLVQHKLLYPAKYGWTTNNYPMLSFWLIAELHRFTHDYLFTGRMLSLLGLITSSVLVGCICRALGISRRAAYISGLFCFAAFCANADYYVGMDDPQMLSLAFFLFGLFTYIKTRHSRTGLVAVAFIFVFAGCIKHNPIDFPLAVLIDLLFISASMFSVFVCTSAILCIAAVLLNILIGGPFFLQELLMPRSYSAMHVLTQSINVFGPLLLPLLIAICVAWSVRLDSHRRILPILLLTSLSLGSYFSGGSGVSINAYFSAILAMSIALGIFMDSGSAVAPKWFMQISWPDRELMLMLWLLIPLAVSGNFLLLHSIRIIHAEESAFAQDLTTLRSRPGPALCESLLACNFAGKPYIYDPFNATRLIQEGHLDASVVVRGLQQRQYAIVQMDNAEGDAPNLERFSPMIAQAIQRYYIRLPQTTGSVFYVPN